MLHQNPIRIGLPVTEFAALQLDEIQFFTGILSFTFDF